ncbi:MAG: electron transfer flavoprotein subunit beta/FixA family protein [Actinobacteria bacterium]|nr:electron transfer flavoprotein subunit beta/FixA family protein [Actinomycetota bacterium]
MRLVVLAKQVPDTRQVTGQVMREDGTLNRAALPAVYNPDDLYALEQALRLKDRFGGRVTVVTMGPPAAVRLLQESLYRGADEVILLSDGRFAGADTLATSYVLSLAVRRLGVVDLVLCGRQAIDGDTAQVGPQVAQQLGLPQVTYVNRVDDLAGGSITVRRRVDEGYQTVRCPLPALLTVTDEAPEPRPPSAKLLMIYKNVASSVTSAYDDSYLDPESPSSEVCHIDHMGRPLCRARVIVWDMDAVGAERERVGLHGSATRVRRVENVVLAASQARMVAATDEELGDLVAELRREHILE